MFDLDMYHGIRIRDGFHLVKQNPGWILSCEAESGITGISAGLYCSCIPFVYPNNERWFWFGEVRNSSQ